MFIKLSGISKYIKPIPKYLYNKPLETEEAAELGERG
jgi:hypothetical protein